MTVKTPTSMEELEEIFKTAEGKLVVVDFFATWCGPCRFMRPKFHKHATEYPDIICVEIDVDENEGIAIQYQVESMPTFVFIKNSEEIMRIQGKKPDELRSIIEANK